ncbi:MAG: alpha/beta fold hydrolase [Planctomycetota bacterium]
MLLLYAGIVIGAIVGGFGIYLLIVALVPGFSVPQRRLERAGHANRASRPALSGPRHDVSFEVKGTPLSAWLYLPEAQVRPFPCVVMAHGLGGTKDAGLEAYAARFQAAGFAVLAFDYRNLGKSGGEPRQLVWIPSQLEDTSAAVEYARSLREVDPERIALWGTSLSAGHAIVTASGDHRIACVCAQCPLLHGGEAGLKLLKREGIAPLFRMIPHGQRDLVRSWFGLEPHRIPLFGRQGSTALMADEDAWNTFGELVPDGFVNEVCARIIIRVDKYWPVRHAAKVRCPVLLQVTEDEASFQRKALEKTKERLGPLAEVIRYPIGHFDIYLGESFERSVSDELRFLRTHLFDVAQDREGPQG